jgi:hypothetical protein
MRNRDDAMQGVEQDENAFGEDEGEALDPEGESVFLLRHMSRKGMYWDHN